MLKLYATDGADESDFDGLCDQGQSALNRGRYDESIRLFYAALHGHAHVGPEEFRRVADLLRRAFVGAGKAREAISVDWYMRDENRSKDLLARVPPQDRARTLLASVDGLGDRGADLAQEAAGLLETSGLLVRASLAFERAGQWERARILWSRLSQQLATAHYDYEAALASFNQFRSSQRVGDTRAARSAGLAAIHHIEEASDSFERTGQRERAFDGYRVLIAIGRETHTFEHELDGFVNALRILREDHLRHYALQTYEEAIEAASKEGELVAAATLAREMSAYARKEHEPAIANHATLLEADLWQRAARAQRERNGAVGVAEHALLAAVLALGEIGQYQSIGRVYIELSLLPLDEAKRAYYARACRRYVNARNELLDASSVPQHLRLDSAFPDVWHVDLIEWEEAGRASETCASVLLETGGQHIEPTRRRALLTRLVALAAEEHPTDAAAQEQLCTSLGELQLYVVLSPLERLAAHANPKVREAAVRALGQFRYKRTFQTIRKALDDPDERVSSRAAQTIEQLRFPVAIDPLSRIYREAQAPRAREAAIKALADIERPEAAELLLGVLSHGSPSDRTCAVEALTKTRRKAFVTVAKATLAELDPQARTHVRDIFRARGIPT